MTWGTSIFLFAVGAILKWAVTAQVSGVNLQTIGVILMVVGAVGLALSFVYIAMWRERRRPLAADPYARRDPVERDPSLY